MKIKKILLLLICLFTLNVKADTCSTSDLNHLKELAKNVSFKYEYEIINGNEGDLDYEEQQIFYKITAINLQDDLLVKVKSDEELIFKKDNPTLTNFLNGENVTIQIYAYTTNNCSGTLLLTKKVELPFYNIYSQKEECLTYKDFKFCQEFGRFNIDDDKFYQELEEYKNQNSILPNDIKNNSKLIIILIIVVLLVITVLIVIINKIVKKRKKEDKDL